MLPSGFEAVDEVVTVLQIDMHVGCAAWPLSTLRQQRIREGAQ